MKRCPPWTPTRSWASSTTETTCPCRGAIGPTTPTANPDRSRACGLPCSDPEAGREPDHRRSEAPMQVTLSVVEGAIMFLVVGGRLMARDIAHPSPDLG